MKERIQLGEHSFKKTNEEEGNLQYTLEGEYEGAFFLSVDEGEKRIDVCMIMGCRSCSEGVRNLEAWWGKLCENEECWGEDGCQKDADGEECERNPLDKIWEAMGKEAEKQFPDYEIDLIA